MFHLARRALFSLSGSQHLHFTSLRFLHSGGRNLSDRYQTLERSLRGTDGPTNNIDPEKYQNFSLAADNILKKRTEVFRGFEIPHEPTPPLDDECCMSNCAVCVYDLYEEALDEYRTSLVNLRRALTAQNIPEEEWPTRVRSSPTMASGDRREAVYSAFEEMERALAKKHQTVETASAGRSSGPYRRPTRPQWFEPILKLYEGLQWIIFSRL